MLLIEFEEFCFLLACPANIENVTKIASVAAHFANGYHNESTMLWAEGRSEWMLLSSIPELHTAVTAKDQPEQG